VALEQVLRTYADYWVQLSPRMYVTEIERVAALPRAGDDVDLEWLTELLVELLRRPFEGDPTFDPTSSAASGSDAPTVLGPLIDQLRTLAADFLTEESIELDRLADRLEYQATQELPWQIGDMYESNAAMGGLESVQAIGNQPDPVTAELLDMAADPIGVLSWWLSPNTLLGQSPAEAARSGREAEVHFAAQQSLDDSW
jgi:hypothetical protein